VKLDAAHEFMRHALAGGRTAGGYLLAGSLRGAVRVLVERILQELMCSAARRPCGECRACRQVLQHTHPDALWIEPQKKSRRIAVEQVREIQGRVYRTSFEGGWRAVVISAADRLTAEAANAFLKTLEEPPAKCVMFLLTDSPQSLLPTIVSRCQRVSIDEEPETPAPEVEKALTRVLLAPRGGGASAIARADALRKVLQSIKDGIEKEIDSEVSDGEPVDKEDLEARVGARFRERQAAVMRFVMLWQRDLLMLRCGAGDVLFNPRYADDLRRHAESLSVPEALANIDAVEELCRRLERNMAGGPVFEAAFAALK
jgi:DNA polymerase-3 subunit delta'